MPRLAAGKQAFLRAHHIPSALEVLPDETVHSIAAHTDASRIRHLAFAVDQVPLRLQRSLHMEFGVRNALSINFLANYTKKRGVTWHGFDSFVGLPRSTRGKKLQWGEGAMSRQGELPKVRRNVLLHPGWFNETLPPMMTSIRASERALAAKQAREGPRQVGVT